MVGALINHNNQYNCRSNVIVTATRGKAGRRNHAIILGRMFSYIFVASLSFYFGYSKGVRTTCSPLIQSNTTHYSTSREKSENKFDHFLYQLPSQFHSIATSVSSINRQDFITKFDFGIPWTSNFPGNEDVIILHRYDTNSAMSDRSFLSSQQSNQTYEQSTFNIESDCDNMKVIVTQPVLPVVNDNNIPSSRTCIAIVGQHDSSHIHKFFQSQTKKKKKRDADRLNEETILDSPWTLVSSLATPFDTTMRTGNDKGLLQIPPKQVITDLSLQMLNQYINNQYTIINHLRPIVEKIINIAGKVVTINNSKQKPAIVVMICNWGHVELLLNFVCSARAINLSLDGYLLFATDINTYNIAKELQLNVFYNNILFPIKNTTTTAAEYGTIEYSHLMLAKVYVSHLIVSCLGYNMLFHDVDIVPLKANYVQHFLSNVDTTQYDLIFQYEQNDPITVRDNIHQQQYLPWLGNTGLYYATANVRTKYFFSVLLRSGDLILKGKSHQAVVNTIMSDHSNLFALRIQTQHQLANDFPLGYHFHKNWTYMKEYMLGAIHPFAFHMNWNTNKETKQKFYEQIGLWYINNNMCVLDENMSVNDKSLIGSLYDTCCLKEPEMKCHFRDKPSKIPCNDSPMIEDQIPFW